MDIIKLTVGEMEENCYIITGPGDTAIVIDPGAAAELIAGELDGRKLSLRKILLTHGHFDHIGAAQWLREHYYAPVYVGGEDEEMLSDRKKSGADMLPYAPFHPVEADARLKDGDVICEGSMKIKVISTPGQQGQRVLYGGGLYFYRRHAVQRLGGKDRPLRRRPENACRKPEKADGLAGGIPPFLRARRGYDFIRGKAVKSVFAVRYEIRRYVYD